MRKCLCLTLLLILAVSFAAGMFATPAKAKMLDCWTSCKDGILWECCEISRGHYVLLRCRPVIPETPC
jgi:hypothetical protein